MAASAKNSKSDARLDAIVNLSKRRGLVFPSSEIYGGLGRHGTTGRWASSSRTT